MFSYFNFKMHAGPLAVAEAATRLMDAGIKVTAISAEHVRGALALDLEAIEPSDGWGTWTDEEEGTRAAIETRLRVLTRLPFVALDEWSRQT